MTLLQTQIVSKCNFLGRLKVLFNGWITVDVKIYTQQDGVTVVKSESLVHCGVRGFGHPIGEEKIIPMTPTVDDRKPHEK